MHIRTLFPPTTSRLIATLLLLVLWASARGADMVNWPTADELFQQARAATKDKPYESIRLFKRGLSLQPDAIAARLELAHLYETRNNLGGAVTELRRCVDSKPTAANVRDLVRVITTLEDTLGVAIEAEKGAASFPDDAGLQLLAGKCLLAAGASEKAIPLLKRFVKKTPGNGEAHALLGKALEQQGNYPAALRAYRKALATAKQNATARDGVKRLRLRAIEVADCWVFPPAGWIRSGDSLWYPQTGQKVRIKQAPEGSPAESARTLAQGAIPTEYVQQSQDGFMERAIAKLVADAAKQGKTVSRKEARALVGADYLPRYALATEEITEPYPGALAEVSPMPGVSDKLLPLFGAGANLALVIVPAGQPVSLVMGCSEGGGCREVLLELAECIVPGPVRRAE